jgi:3-oxoacyl-[acyl-carrier protein] reductase
MLLHSSNTRSRSSSLEYVGLLDGKIALVTGASRGLGRAIAVALAQAGADLVLNYRERRDEADEVKTAIEQIGRRAVAVQADVANASEVSALLDRVEKDLGSVSILVNNAGVTRPQAIEDIAEQDFDDLIRINLKSMFLVTQRALPAMRAAHFGRIINLSSVAAQVGGVIGPHYAASKAGMIGMTHSYASLLAKEGITVNAIAPALVLTDMVSSNPRAKPDLIPVGRFGDPCEVASVAVMLATNSYITGQTINVNGGWYMSS